MNRLRRAAILAMAVAVAACDSDTTGIEDLDLGRFEARLSGDVSTQLEGTAASGESEPGFHDLILLQDGSAEILIFHVDDEFREGRFGVSDNLDLQYENGIVAEMVINGRYFVARDGTLDLDGVSSAGIDGTVRFEAVELDEFDEPIFSSEVTVQAAFRTDFEGSIFLDQTRIDPVRRSRAATPGGAKRP